MADKTRLAICIPAFDMVHSRFAASLAALERPPATAFLWELNEMLARSRGQLLARAVALDADQIMLLDHDTVFASDTYKRLAAYLEDGVNFVAAPYWGRAYPWSPVVFKKNTDPMTQAGATWIRVHPNRLGERPLRQVEGVGIGCSLMSGHLAKRLLERWPMSAGGPFSWTTPVGDDATAFSERMKELGEKIWITPDVTVGHCGTVVVDERVAQLLRDAGVRG